MARQPAPGPVVIPNCAEVKHVFLQNGQEMSIVLHGNLTAAGPLNPGIAESIFSGTKAAAGTTTFFGHVHPSCSYVRVEVKDLRAPNNPSIVSTGTALPGTSAGTPLSQGSALVVTLRTQFTGKGFTGRSYLMGLDAGTLTDARTFSDIVGAAGVAFIQAIQSAMNTQGLPLVVAQRHLLAGTTSAGAALPERAANVVPVTQIVIADHRIDSQRRRLGR